MPLNTNTGEYEERTVEAVRAAIYTELQNRLDDEPEALDSAILRAYVDSIAVTIVEQQEAALDSIHDAAFLDSALGDDLEKVIDLVAADRRGARTATGIQHFISDSRVDQDYSIGSSTSVQTSDGSITFETTESRTLTFYDDFERTSPLDEYSGDTSGFTQSSTWAATGSNSLKGTGGSAGTITKDNSTFVRGDEVRATVRNSSGGNGPDEAFLRYLATSTHSYAATVNWNNNELEIWDGGTRQVTTSVSGGIPNDTGLELHVDTRADGTHYARLYDGSTELATAAWSEQNPDTYVGEIGFQHDNGEVFFDDVAHSRVAASIEATTAGGQGNVASDTLTVMPNPPAGVDSTTNPVPTGDDDFRDTNGLTLVAGQDTESDNVLRTRIQQNAEERQHPILRAVSELPTVTSATIRINTSDSTDGQGRPGKSFEVIVPSTATYVEVAEAIFEEKAWTSNPVGGYVGTKQTETVTAYNGQTFDVNFSSAPIQDIDMTLSIVVDDSYDGDEDLRERIVEYIGGTRPDGSKAIGTEIGEDVYIDQLKEVVTDDEGVIGFDDGNTSFTPSTTTDANGLTIIDVADTEIAEVDGRDGSITINKTTI